MASGPLHVQTMTVLICGANGSIGNIVAQEESKTNKVVGTYRNQDEQTKVLEQHSNITLIKKDVLESTDMKDVVDKARQLGTISKVYWLLGESWNIGWDKAKLEDFQKAIQVCAEPLASLLIECKPELNDDNNLMRWVSISGLSSLIYAGGPNKPVTGSAKHMAEFYFKSASAFWTWKKNLFNNVILGNSKRTKNLHIGYPQDKLKEIYAKDIPIGTATDPSNVAELLLWLNSDKNNFMTGQDIIFDGGESIRTRDNITNQ